MPPEKVIPSMLLYISPRLSNSWFTESIPSPELVMRLIPIKGPIKKSPFFCALANSEERKTNVINVKILSNNKYTRKLFL